MSSAVSLKNIAEVCGVSAAAVSLALTGKQGRISEETRQRILDCAKKMHYHGNPAARSLRKKQTDQITLVLPPFFSGIPNNLDFNSHIRQMHWNLIFSVISCAARKGYDVKLLPVLPAQTLPELLVRLDRTRTDGIIFFSASFFRPLFAELNVPKIAAEITGISEASDLDLDPLPGFRQALDYFAAKKHFCKFGYAAPLKAPGIGNHTQEYVRQTLAELGLPLERVIDIPDNFGIIEAVTSGRFDGLDAVFCGNDTIADGVLRSCRFCKKTAPVIIGYDDNPVWHEFSTIGIDRDHLASQAVELLFSLMQGKNISHVKISTRFLNRISTSKGDGN